MSQQRRDAFLEQLLQSARGVFAVFGIYIGWAITRPWPAAVP